jgi:CDP-diacylglycerol---serine O-phosphatidyltransferase
MYKMRMAMFNLPNLLTGCNLLCGILSIFATIVGRIDLVPWLIFTAAIFDFLDGFVARILKQQSPLGAQLDSLADMVTFGVAPGCLMFVVLILCGAQAKLSETNHSIWEHASGDFAVTVHFWVERYYQNFFYPYKNPNFSNGYLYLPFLAFLIPFMSMFRLAKFNLDTRQTEGFIGLNTPANTLFFCSFPLLMLKGFDNPMLGKISILLLNYQVPSLLIVLFSALLVSEIPFFSFKFKKFGFKGNEIRYVFLLISLTLLVLLGMWSMGLIILLYLIIAIVQNVFSQLK